MSAEPDLRRALRAWAEDFRAWGFEDVAAGGDLPAELQAALEVAPAPAAEPRSAAPGGDGDGLERIAAEVAACTLCGLSGSRTRTVPGQGSPTARIVFVGEAPGHEEDQQGLAFVGPSGQLLTKMIGAMGFTRDEVFIMNVLKCRPPNNRDPRPEEAAACKPFLRRQLALLRPGVLIALGAHAARNLLDLPPETPVGRLRGRAHSCEGIPLIATYHPSYLLRSPQMKRKAWEDLQLALRTIGLEPPGTT